MTFVVTEACIKCKLTDCVEVCPVDCFHEGPNFLVIDPDECIDCTLCEPECPVEAIYSEDELPAGQEQFLEINAELSRDWPVITEMKDPPEDSDEWRTPTSGATSRTSCSTSSADVQRTAFDAAFADSVIAVQPVKAFSSPVNSVFALQPMKALSSSAN